jgi:C-terminal processing protease CtpA/Prc
LFFQGGCITIKSIKKSGWFSGTKLKVGHEIISVNGSNCYGLSVSQVEKKFKNAGSTMSVIADNPMDTQRRSKIKL